MNNNQNQMKNTNTPAIIRAATIYLVCLILLLTTGCKKETMSYNECQQHYGKIIASYNSSLAGYNEQYQAGMMTRPYWVNKVNVAARLCNQQIIALNECQGLNLIDMVE